jgi:hypothetical protein
MMGSNPMLSGDVFFQDYLKIWVWAKISQIRQQATRKLHEYR